MSHYTFNWYALPLIFTALSSLLVGLLVLRRDWTSRVGKALFLVTVTLSVWLGATAVVFCSTDSATALMWTRVAYVGLPLLPASIYLYVSVGLRSYVRDKVLIWTTLLAALAFVGLAQAGNVLLSGVEKHWWGYYPAYGSAGLVFLGYFTVLILMGTIQLRGRLSESPEGSVFRRRITISFIAIAVLCVAAIDFLAVFGVPVYPFGFAAVLAFLGLILALERRYHIVYMTPAFAAEQILATMQGAVLVTNPEGAVEMSNHAAQELLGRSETELLDLNVDQVFDSETECRSLMNDCLAGTGIQGHETSWKRRDGSVLDVSISASLLPGGRDQVLGIVLAALDITSRKRSEEALELTQLSVDCAADLIHWIGPDGRLLYVSDSSCRRHGYSREEMLGMTVFDLDPSQSLESWEKHWREIKEHGSLSFESIHRTRTGEVFPIELTANHVERNGHEYNFAIGRDITERRRWEEALAAEKEHLALLNEAAVEISHCVSVSEVQRTGMRICCKTTKCDGGIFWLLPSEVRSRIMGNEGLTRKGRAQLVKMLRTLPAVERVMCEKTVARLGEAEISGNGASDENVFAGALLVPVLSRGKTLGVLCLATKRGRPALTAEDSALAEGIAALVGVAVENARLYEDAQYLAQRDPVTGLLNHRGINAQLERELARSGRSGGCFTVVMMDLDNFKLFNDTYGHACGDQVLQDVSGILARAVRRSDVVGRYGGDEFLALLPDTDAGAAVTTIERIRETLDHFGYKPDGRSPVPVVLSYGVATYPFDGRHASELLAAADANLYRSKRRGGNCVTASGGEESPGETKSGIFTVLDGLVTAVDSKDHYTRKHSDYVCEQAVALASKLGLSSETQRCLRIAAILHDVGKIGIPDHILRKPGSLTEKEYEAVKQHVNLGELIINEIPNLADVLSAVSSHHEQYDGQGYPRGLKGEDIPLLGRILAVTDAYAAMTSDRPYRKALTPEEARLELKRVSGTQLDPRIVSAFLAMLDDPSYAEVLKDLSSVSVA